MKRRLSNIAMAAVAAACMLSGCESTSAQVYPNYSYTPDTAYNYTPSYAPAPPVAAAPANSDVRFNAEQLDQMLGPIALYPDPLLTETLAACSYPQDVADLGQMLQYDSTPGDDEIAAKPWDNSVKALAKYPSVVQMMASQIDWTEAIGAAMVNQQQDVMDSVQRLRAKAQAAKTLVTTPQQEIVQDSGVIQILPAQPEIIYVPTYDPLVVYEPQPFGTWITFGLGVGINRWWDLDCDWHNHFFRRGVSWGRDWRRPVFVNNINNARWEHDRSRPIPAPRNAFVPPRGVDRRGWTGNGRAPGALNPGVTPRVQAQPKPITPQRVQTPQRAVQGLPPAAARHPARVPNVPQAPRETPPAIPRVTTPPATPVRPATPVVPATPRVPVAPATPRVPAIPAAPRVTTPPAPVQPRVQPAPPVQRPVTGLPPRAVAPARPAPPAPRAAPAPAPRPAPAPAFRPGNSGGSNRGHSSMKR